MASCLEAAASPSFRLSSSPLLPLRRSSLRLPCLRASATFAPSEPQSSSSLHSSSPPKVLLEVQGLSAVVADTGTEILKGMDLVIREGEVSSRHFSSVNWKNA